MLSLLIRATVSRFPPEPRPVALSVPWTQVSNNTCSCSEDPSSRSPATNDRVPSSGEGLLGVDLCQSLASCLDADLASYPVARAGRVHRIDADNFRILLDESSRQSSWAMTTSSRECFRKRAASSSGNAYGETAARNFSVLAPFR